MSAMPPLLSQFMDDDSETELDNRAKGGSLAVNLARHSADSWYDATLPDDYQDIAEFLHVNIERVLFLIGATKPDLPEKAEDSP
ncbi:MAG: hypothetical protein ACI8PW_000980 [Methylophilaceae bacterium]|jgi:hypothetical protein